MNKRQKDALYRFAESVKELKEAGVVRSDRYLGDVAEFLCADYLGLELEPNKRAQGHDAIKDGRRYQIKYGGGTKTNIALGDPKYYDEVLVVLGRDSVVRNDSVAGDFVIYRVPAAEVQSNHSAGKSKLSCGRKRFAGPLDYIINLQGITDELSENATGSGEASS